jgi:hypothetical protein
MVSKNETRRRNMSENIELNLNELTGNLKGLTKRFAIKVLNSDFIEEVKKILVSYGIEAAKVALKKYIQIATQQTTNVICRKFAIILSIITIIFTLFAIILISAIGGNIIIPIVVLVILIVMIWSATSITSKLIARKISGIIFKAIEGKTT